jgi:tetratricopeptide (TPR) repeat protein
MDCPRCGATAVSIPECPRCGVVFAKARGERAPRTAPRPAASPPAAWRALVLPTLGLALVVGGAAMHLRRGPGPPAAGPSEPRAPVPDWSTGRDESPEPPPAVEPPLPMTSSPEIADAGLRAASAADADRETAARLSERLRARAPLTAEDVRAAEDLYARYPVPARDLLESVLIGAAVRHREGRRYDAAATLLDRAQAVAPASPRGPKALLALCLETGDWACAEGAARELLARAPSDAEAARGLAYALVRQDRSREAIDLLAAFLDVRPDPETRALLERFRRDQGSEASLDEARLAHFHVRYDGDAHEDVGREILRVLDRHYATLVRTFGHQPAAPIPVILLSRESYYDATGAPAWSGGQYDGFDGRVRLPIRGLTASLTAELDDTLLHELTHAFVADLSRGLAPREVHEGLAQLMEGKRSQALLGEEGLRALADGRLRGVGAFYLSALGLVEDLVGQRGQGGINEVLRAMAETGSSDEALRRVYGKSLEDLKRDWATRLRQRYGS